VLAEILIAVFFYNRGTIQSVAVGLMKSDSGLPASASTASVVAADREWLDETAASHAKWTAIDQRMAIGNRSTFGGTVVADTDWAATGAIILYVSSSDSSGTVPVVLNKHTSITWPQEWGALSPKSSGEEVAVRVPTNAPDSFVGREVSVTTRRMGVPSGVVRLFAVEITFR
jgi:hypothetical protein